MKVLVLHNNNLPSFLLLESQTKDISIRSVSVALPETDIPDFDTHISNRMSDEHGANLKRDNYDIIILPYNTTENNIEYTGLRILAHLRLTRDWNCMSVPILFIGPDTTDEMDQFCELSSLLYSFNVFRSSKNKQEDVFKMLRWINKETKPVENVEDTPEYKDFLKRMKSLSAPANYATHHSLANEWAIMRWNDMMTNPVELPNNEFTKMLYYKYLRALYGDSQKIKKWLKKQGLINLEKIDYIEREKKLVLIDDEWNKGWAAIIAYIAKSSGFKFENCAIKKKWDRNTLINNVEDFIDNNDADCYLLDLRLHETDFDEVFLKNNSLRLSGYEILDHIKKNNEANSVVIFSASNKLWNFKKTVWNYKDEEKLKEKEGAIDYVLKETPESSLKAQESYNIFYGFVNAIRLSFNLSKLKEVVNKQKKLKSLYPNASILDEFVRLVLFDKGKNSNSLLKACLMILWTFVEEYISKRYSIIPTERGAYQQLYSKIDNANCGIVSNRIFIKKQKITNTGYSRILEARCKVMNQTTLLSGFEEVDNSKFGITLCSFFLIYNIDEKIINNILIPLGNVRNKMSHESGEVDLSLKMLYDFYFKIIVPIIEHDYN